MSTQDILKAETQVREAELALRRAQLALARAEAENKLPPEPPVGAHVKFKVRYRAGETEYTYLALRTPEGWLLSGKQYAGRTVTWETVIHVADKNYSGRPHIQAFPA